MLTFFRKDKSHPYNSIEEWLGREDGKGGSLKRGSEEGLSELGHLEMCSGLVSADFKENGNIMLRENRVFAAIYSQSAIFKLITHTHTHTHIQKRLS